MLLINAKIYTMDAEIIENGFIFIKDKKINKVGSMQALDLQDENTIDLRGKSVYPGFIDAHTHIGLFENGLGFEGEDGNEYTDPSTPHMKAIDAVNPMDKSFEEALLAGITTVVISPGSANPIGGQIFAMKTSGFCVDDMVIKKPVAIKFAFGENPKMIYNDKSQAPMTRMATAAIIREQLSKAKRYMCEKDKAEKNPTEYDLPEYDAKCEALIPLLKKKISAHIHAHRADDIFTAMRIAKEFDINYVIIHATEGHLIATRLKSEQVSVLSGPILSDRSKPELVNLSTKTPGVLTNNGILLAITTDHPETPVQYLQLCAALAIRDGMERYEALKAVTINPAKICGIFDKVGSINAGKDADLVVFEDSPFDIMKKPLMIICNGEIKNNSI
ncbi:MAG: amidohydrolase [Acutalibacteraceae bacterium]